MILLYNITVFKKENNSPIEYKGSLFSPFKAKIEYSSYKYSVLGACNGSSSAASRGNPIDDIQMQMFLIDLKFEQEKEGNFAEVCVDAGCTRRVRTHNSEEKIINFIGQDRTCSIRRIHYLNETKHLEIILRSSRQKLTVFPNANWPTYTLSERDNDNVVGSVVITNSSVFWKNMKQASVV